MVYMILTLIKILKLRNSIVLKYLEVLNRGLAVMDSTATSLCMDNKIPLVVFNIDNHENILKAALGENIGTTVGGND